MTPSQIEKRREELKRILSKPRPARKPGARTGFWEGEQQRARYELAKLRWLEMGVEEPDPMFDRLPDDDDDDDAIPF